MKRALPVILGLAALQAALALGYVLVERSRVPEAVFVAERLDAPAPLLELEGPAGPLSLSGLGPGPVLVHFWATWCAPCRAELPGLLEAVKDEGVVLVAVTDEPWPDVERFFDGTRPASVARDPSGLGAARFGVSGLPDTFVVDGSGRIRARIGGPRDWTSGPARAFLREVKGSR